MKRWIIGTIWRENGSDWVPGASVSSAADHVSREAVAIDFLATQKAHHPAREFAGGIYIEELEKHLAEKPLQFERKA